jgi:RimJ/RimL family protein N-acetyltransferase
MNLQPILENDLVKLIPLHENNFEDLYAVASDPLIWEQHPNKDRWKKEVFENFFKGALESGGAFKIIDKANGKVIGSTRFYKTGIENKELAIGYTFFARKYWGGKYNPAVKRLMMDYAFQFVDHILLHVGAVNIRSQKAIERLGAVKIAEEEIAYYGEASKLNFIYRIDR